MKDLSLNQTLEALGLSTRPAPKTLARKEGSKHILRGAEILFTGTAGDVWAWLGARAAIVASEHGFWCKRTAPLATSGSPRFEGFQAAAADMFRDGDQSDEWLYGWDEFDGIKRAEVERATADDRPRGARFETELTADELEAFAEGADIYGTREEAADLRCRARAVRRGDSDPAAEVEAFLSNPPAPTVRAAGTSGTVMVGGREEVEGFSNFLR